jgi:hypothetical protein
MQLGDNGRGSVEAATVVDRQYQRWSGFDAAQVSQRCGQG